MKSASVAIVGSGNIATDLMFKIEKSDSLELFGMAGIDPDSDGLAKAEKRGYFTTTDSLEGLMDHSQEFEIAFEATSAKVHLKHSEIYQEAGKIAIDLTPAAVGPYVVPTVNLPDSSEAMNVNMVTCGGQATIPMMHAIDRVADVDYGEIVSTVASKSAGPGTRKNIDEFTQTTARGLEEVGGADEAKALIILNPAEPPLIMRNTVFAIVDTMDQSAIEESIQEMIDEVSTYVPGYHLKSEVLFDHDENTVTVLLEIEGAGDYLPKYAGNLDIMTAAATRVGELYAERLVDSPQSAAT